MEQHSDARMVTCDEIVDLEGRLDHKLFSPLDTGIWIDGRHHPLFEGMLVDSKTIEAEVGRISDKIYDLFSVPNLSRTLLVGGLEGGRRFSTDIYQRCMSRAAELRGRKAPSAFELRFLRIDKGLGEVVHGIPRDEEEFLLHSAAAPLYSILPDPAKRLLQKAAGKYFTPLSRLDYGTAVFLDDCLNSSATFDAVRRYLAQIGIDNSSIRGGFLLVEKGARDDITELADASYCHHIHNGFLLPEFPHDEPLPVCGYGMDYKVGSLHVGRHINHVMLMNREIVLDDGSGISPIEKAYQENPAAVTVQLAPYLSRR